MRGTSSYLNGQWLDGECVSITGCSTRPPGKITSLCPSSMRCLNGWQSTHTFATSMDTLVIIKFQSILMTRVRLPSLAPMGHSFGLCNAPASFQRCMMAIFSDLIENIREVFMDDFSVYGTYFNQFLENLDKVLKICQETHLFLNWEKCHFMVREDRQHAPLKWSRCVA